MEAIGKIIEHAGKYPGRSGALVTVGLVSLVAYSMACSSAPWQAQVAWAAVAVSLMIAVCCLPSDGFVGEGYSQLERLVRSWNERKGYDEVESSCKLALLRISVHEVNPSLAKSNEQIAQLMREGLSAANAVKAALLVQLDHFGRDKGVYKSILKSLDGQTFLWSDMDDPIEIAHILRGLSATHGFIWSYKKRTNKVLARINSISGANIQVKPL